jgi:N-6 DNA methylase
MADLEQLAQTIAERAASAWWGSFSGHDDGIPLGAIAALALLGRIPEEGPHPAERLLEADDEEITQLLVAVWALFSSRRPELALRCGPFCDWLNEEPRNESTASGAAAVVRAAVKAGLLEVTLDPDTACEVDVLGHVHQTLRSKGAKQGQGQFYTPAIAADAIARMTISGAKPGQSICDPAAGTGGLLRAAAAQIRAEGHEPREFLWYACDIDPVAVAGLAVNFSIWRLGVHVVIGCANTLTEGDWDRRALAEQKAAVEAAISKGRG